ncbi:hypothetical protein MMC09_006578 [Bachmanniomyces sp. S44760]|nr:hypothetical protein [Bachmanniomyces sp. S44760]
MAPPSHLFRPMKSSIQRGNISILTQDIHLRLSTLPLPRSSASYPLHFSKDPGAPSLILTQLTLVRNLIYQSLDVVDVSTWTGDAHDPSFIAGQLRLLFDFIQEARQNLKGGEDAVGVKWWQVYTDEKIFEPPIPQDLSFHLSIHEASLLLTIRTLQPIDPNTPTSTFSTETLTGFSLRQRLGLVAKLPDHDESGETFMYRGQEVKVKEKVRVESQDPSLMAVMAKLSALEHALAFSRRNLMIVMGITDEDDEA